MKGWKLYWAVMSLIMLVGWSLVIFDIVSVTEIQTVDLDIWTVGCLLGLTIVSNKDNGTERR